jgi:predicted membrane-bound dolichyl-phosphate-mannose-protein mannosyltransferase
VQAVEIPEARVSSSPDVTAPGQAGPRWWRWIAAHPEAALGTLLVVSLLFRVWRLDAPDRRLIFDEAYYVNAARVILGLPIPSSAPVSSPVPGIDPNREHPPFGKVVLAASIAAIGDGPIGWRLPSLLAGLGSIALVYGIVRTAGGDGWLGVLAAAIFAFDNLALVHSRIGTLDMMMTALLLGGALFHLGRWSFGAGAACAAAALVKIPGVYGVLALLIYEALKAMMERRASGVWPRESIRSAAFLLAGFLPVWLIGMWLLDLLVTQYSMPWEHLAYIVGAGAAHGSAAGPTNFESYPWQWLYNEVQMPYLQITDHVVVNGEEIGTRFSVYFRGAMTPAIIGAAPLALGYAGWRWWRTREPLALWVMAWVAGTYLPYFLLALVTNRITYIYYFLPVLPAVTVAIALFLRHSGLPRVAVWAYLAAVLLGFLGYFPFRYL